MTPIRLIVAGLPPLMEEIVRMLAADGSVEIVATLDGDHDLVRGASDHHADALLMPESSAEPLLAVQILLANPRMRLLLMSDDADSAQLYRLLPHRMAIEDVSPTELFAAIQGRGRYATPGLSA